MKKFVKDFITYYLFCSNKGKYVGIAENIRSTPFEVYRIAQGKRCRSAREMEVLSVLKKEGIVRNIKFRYRTSS